jgi:hypothetical protein
MTGGGGGGGRNSLLGSLIGYPPKLVEDGEKTVRPIWYRPSYCRPCSVCLIRIAELRGFSFRVVVQSTSFSLRILTKGSLKAVL